MQYLELTSLSRLGPSAAMLGFLSMVIVYYTPSNPILVIKAGGLGLRRFRV